MIGKILGVYSRRDPHNCKTPTKLFKRLGTVWQCPCNKMYILEPRYVGYGHYWTDWWSLSKEDFKKLKDFK